MSHELKPRKPFSGQRSAGAAAVVACIAGAATADDLHVPGEYPTIAAAVAGF